MAKSTSHGVPRIGFLFITEISPFATARSTDQKRKHSLADSRGLQIIQKLLNNDIRLLLPPFRGQTGIRSAPDIVRRTEINRSSRIMNHLCRVAVQPPARCVKINPHLKIGIGIDLQNTLQNTDQFMSNHRDIQRAIPIPSITQLHVHFDQIDTRIPKIGIIDPSIFTVRRTGNTERRRIEDRNEKFSINVVQSTPLLVFQPSFSQSFLSGIVGAASQQTQQECDK